MPRLARTLPALTVAAALAASTAVAGAADAAPAVQHGRSAVTFHSSDNHRVIAPATTRPGIAHLRNTGRGEVFLVGAKHSGGSARQVIKDLKAPSAKPLLKNYRVAAIMSPKSGDYTMLTRGTYYFIDVSTFHLKAKRVETMTVTGPRVDARTPRGRGLVVTTNRNLHLPGTIARSGFLHVQNHSSALAEFLFVGIDNKATRKMLAALVANPSYAKLFSVANLQRNPFLFAPIEAVGPRSESWAHYHGKPGRYVATVFTIKNRFDGQLHHNAVRILHLK